MRTTSAILFFAAMLCATLPLTAQEGKVALTVVTYAGLTDAIVKQRGKVVVVDIWAEYCLPCKKAFPHLVELHEKYAKDGLAVVSVSLDPLEEKDAQARALKFLMKQRATFTNLLLAEEADVWQEKLDLSTPPALFVYDRRGKSKRFVPEADEPIDQAAVEKWIVKLLAEKGP